MNYRALSFLLAASLAVLGVWGTKEAAVRHLCTLSTLEAAEPAPAKPSALPPLKVDRSAPLLLEDAPPQTPARPKSKQGKLPVADNSACHVCHGNYDRESLALVHAKANVGCVKCHGESVAHRNDEDNITPPDVMFPLDRIDAGCLKCHETHDAPARKVIAVWQQRCPAKHDPAELVCTDCHGEHRLRFRTVWWDRGTGKLAMRKGERVKYAPDYTRSPKPPKPISAPPPTKPEKAPTE